MGKQEGDTHTPQQVISGRPEGQRLDCVQHQVACLVAAISVENIG